MSNTNKAKINAIAVSIRKKRESKNYTQEYLAYKLNISQNAYSKIELGYTKITVERLFQIAEVLELNAIDLLEGELEEAEHKFLPTGSD
ncbi:helix-turn-helix domain-containing protein [Mucilaginibacter antarcticus]|uniref:Helix-turn-helix domain-containing protein n=1 Tax=Mucilaginibacter antarcticus TaxID=1855725 RepID=A0ABW5XJU8_9SPHI